ncbi:MAG: aldo/keto reductase [Mangrovicoccus sp.]
MLTRKLGANGPEVGAIGLGCMSFAGFFGSTEDQASLECMAAAVDCGINFWDTSNIYGMGWSERVVGEFLAAEKPDIVLATKVGIIPGPPRSFDNSEDYIRSELEGSLKRLQQDRVDLYYIHRREAERPVEEVAETMAKLIEEGLIGGYGLSEVAPSTLRRAHAVHPCMAVQNEYSLWTRQPELGMLHTCAELGVAFIPFSPLARGMLGTVPVDPTKMDSNDWRATSPRFVEPNYSYNRAAIDAFREWCEAKGWTTTTVALAWVLARGDGLIPIPGTRSADHLRQWLPALEIELSPQDMAEIERLLPVGFAHGDRYGDHQIVGVERYC